MSVLVSMKGFAIAGLHGVCKWYLWNDDWENFSSYIFLDHQLTSRLEHQFPKLRSSRDRAGRVQKENVLAVDAVN